MARQIPTYPAVFQSLGLDPQSDACQFLSEDLCELNIPRYACLWLLLCRELDKTPIPDLRLALEVGITTNHWDFYLCLVWHWSVQLRMKPSTDYRRDNAPFIQCCVAALAESKHSVQFYHDRVQSALAHMRAYCCLQHSYEKKMSIDRRLQCVVTSQYHLSHTPDLDLAQIRDISSACTARQWEIQGGRLRHDQQHKQALICYKIAMSHGWQPKDSYIDDLQTGFGDFKINDSIIQSVEFTSHLIPLPDIDLKLFQLGGSSIQYTL